MFYSSVNFKYFLNPSHHWNVSYSFFPNDTDIGFKLTALICSRMAGEFQDFWRARFIFVDFKVWRSSVFIFFQTPTKWVKPFPHDISCVSEYGGERLGGGSVGVSALWWGPLTMPPFHRWAVHRARPTSCPSLPPKLSSIPYRIPPSGASGMKGGCRGGCRGRGGSPPLMFSLGTGCCLFDFQWKQHQRLQFEQIV